mmetsp:Transcript_1967/g.4441  ORF Transcript_1967/g.4441 Transcript_1967/m.4441 type:complete len:241 (+) Transcript_1967:69-791(+)
MDSDKPAELETADPVQWYKEYWMHCLKCEGLEQSISRLHRKLPLRHSSHDGDTKSRNSRLFYWRVTDNSYEDSEGKGRVKFSGKHFDLFARMEIGSSDFVPVVNVKEDDSGKNRVYASRHFDIGDAITFFSEYEEKHGASVLGGIHVRQVKSPEACNAYLTEDRTLRCLETIREGDEITRMANSSEKIERLERIDRVVLCLDKMSVGRIGKEDWPGKGYLVHFADGTIEFEGPRHLLVQK